MSSSAKGRDGKKAASEGELWPRLLGVVRDALYDTVIVTGRACVGEVAEAERTALCGACYAHQAGRQALRAGHVASSLVLGARRVGVSRPRVKDFTLGGEPRWRP